MRKETLQEMVQEINETQVGADEVLEWRDSGCLAYLP